MMKISTDIFTWCVCLLDAAAALTIVALMLETTPKFSIDGVRHGDSQSKWAMVRRLVYSLVAMALVAKAVFIFDGRIIVQPIDAVIWLVLVFAIIFFPVCRACGWIDQDHWLGFRHRKPLA